MNWSKEKISSFAEIVTGGTPSTDKKEFWDGGTIPWLNSGDLNQGTVTKASNFVTEEGYKTSSTKLMPVNTVLIALTGATTGLSAILKIKACANQSVTGIFPSEKHYPEFLYYFFRTQRQRILDAAWGGAQPHINQKYVKDYFVPLPPLSDQIKIATVLSKAEALIKQRKENIDLLDEFLKSSFLKMFGNPVRNEKKNKLVSLGELGSWKSGGTPSRSNPRYFGGDIPWLTSGELESMYVGDSREKITTEAVKNSNASLIEKGSILLGMYDTAALKSSITTSQVTCNQAIAYSKLNPKLCNTIYVYFIIQIGKEYFRRLQRGVRQQNMNLSMIRSIEIMLPPVKLQNQFAAIVEKAEALKEQFNSSLNDLKELYDSLSQRAFKGDLDLSGVVIDHMVPASKGGSTDFENLQVISEKENKERADKHPTLEEFYKQYRQLVFAVLFSVLKNRDDAEDLVSDLLLNLYNGLQKYSIKNMRAYITIVARRAASSFKQKRRLESIPIEFFEGFDVIDRPTDEEGKILWEEVSIQQVSNWINAKYSRQHFSSEMLLRFLQEEQLTTPYYFSSEELKKFPKFNSLDDLHTLIFSSLSGENPYLKLKQVFYNGTRKSFKLNLSEEDIELTDGRTDEQMAGVYFTIE